MGQSISLGQINEHADGHRTQEGLDCSTSWSSQELCLGMDLYWHTHNRGWRRAGQIVALTNKTWD